VVAELAAVAMRWSPIAAVVDLVVAELVAAPLDLAAVVAELAAVGAGRRARRAGGRAGGGGRRSTSMRSPAAVAVVAEHVTSSRPVAVAALVADRGGGRGPVLALDRGARAGRRPGTARRALRAVAVVGARDLDAELDLAGDLDPARAVGGSPIAAAVAVATSSARSAPLGARRRRRPGARAARRGRRRQPRGLGPARRRWRGRGARRRRRSPGAWTSPRSWTSTPSTGRAGAPARPRSSNLDQLTSSPGALNGAHVVEADLGLAGREPRGASQQVAKMVISHHCL
jgi:hypothetical protein